MARSPWKRSAKCGKDSCCVEVSVETTATQMGHPHTRKEVPYRIHVRNSARPKQMLTFTADEWRAFLEGVELGEFKI